MKVKITETRVRYLEVKGPPEGQPLLDYLKDLELEAIEDPNFYNQPGTEAMCRAEIVG